MKQAFSTHEKKLGIKGKLVISKFKAGTKELLNKIEVTNLVVSASTGYGRNLIMRRLGGDTTYGIAIDSGGIGTGTTAPTDADTALETAVLTGINVANASVSNDEVIMSFFMTDAELANGTYNEFGVFIGGRLFARAIISPAHTKASGEDTSVDYTFTLSSV